LSAVLFGLSVATKILPLILLPFLLKYIGFRKTIVYSCITAIVFIISFIPFYNAGLIRHFSTSLQLYFVSFEFNGSIYNFSKWLSGFNYSSKLMIQKVLPVIACFLILLTSFFYKKERLFQFFLFAFFIYFLFSTTVHPWYITPLILFTVITNYKFPIVWSGLIYLTYITYAGNGFKENYFIITIEYLILFAFMISELFIRKINKKPVPSY
ncbi:MAG: mannosyltransferase, partial [Fimbriimonadaceae bacterium]|nr:mannosyltransferase [Chitinophagales bacterium]